MATVQVAGAAVGYFLTSALACGFLLPCVEAYSVKLPGTSTPLGITLAVLHPSQPDPLADVHSLECSTTGDKLCAPARSWILKATL